MGQVSKVLVKTKLITDDNQLGFEGMGIFDQERLILRFRDNEAKVTILLKELILVRETAEAILSYKFNREKRSRFEIVIKDLKKTGTLGLSTKYIEQTKQRFEVKYQLDGNQFSHHYIVTWRNI